MCRHNKLQLTGKIILFAMCLFLLGGCATVLPNPKLEQEFDLTDVARNQLNPADRSDELFFVMTLSGGGTRAAAFAYGVFKELRDTGVVTQGRSGRLLDEVDYISSVSGGSFTAAYYGLYGDKIFDDFERDFLRLNVQGKLISGILSPLQ